MKKECILECSNYYNYGQIDCATIADCFSWAEDEEVDVELVLQHIENQYTKAHMYIFLTKQGTYPQTTRDKYLGLWKELAILKKLEVKQSYECKAELDRFILYWGIAEMTKSQLKEALNLLQKDYMHSFIVLSDSSLNLPLLSDQAFKMADSLKGYYTNYSYLVNSRCGEDVIITAIKGWNGITINCFYTR